LHPHLWQHQREHIETAEIESGAHAAHPVYVHDHSSRYRESISILVQSIFEMARPAIDSVQAGKVVFLVFFLYLTIIYFLIIQPLFHDSSQ
jgi:hypothetical protein